MFKLHTKIFLAYGFTFLVCIGVVLFIAQAKITEAFEREISLSARSVFNRTQNAYDRLSQEVRDEVEKEVNDPDVLKAVQLPPSEFPIKLETPLDILEYADEEGNIIKSTPFSHRSGVVYEEALVRARVESPQPVLKTWDECGLVLEIILPIKSRTGRFFGFVRGGYFLKEHIEELIEYPKPGQLFFLFDGAKLTSLNESREDNDTRDRMVLKEVAEHLKELAPSLEDGVYKLGKERYSVSQIKLTPAAIVSVFSHKQLRERQRELITSILIVAGVGILAVYAAGYLIARGVTRPISKLMASSLAIASGNLDQRVEVKSRDEVGVLANQFNIMAQRLIENQEKLLTMERLSTWRSIGRVVAHEMKNPLFPISAAVENLQKSYHANPELFDDIFDECTDTVLRQSQKLLKIVDEFHQFARMPKPELKPCNLNDVISEVLSLYSVLPEGIEISPKLSTNLPQISADSEQLSRAFQNIVKNAIEAMSDGGTLTVSTEIVPSEQIQIKFTDTGIGMSNETKDKLFMPYFTTKEKGTGLGMAIVQQIIVEHDGVIAVESKVGLGSTFTITLPLSNEEGRRKR